MAIRFECPKCGKHLSATDSYAGKEGKCKCGIGVIVPGQSERIKFRCESCNKAISVRKAHSGKKSRCPTCRNPVDIPLLGTLLPAEIELASPTLAPTAPSATQGALTFECPMCNSDVQGSPGNIMECPDCGSFVEVPGGAADAFGANISGPTISADLGDFEAGGEAVGEAAGKMGKEPCPSCDKRLPEGTPICTRCGIYTRTGRPILTAWDVDPEELEDKAHGVVKAVSWLIRFGIYPFYSEAMGNHKPYATWAITAVTVLISIWFLVIDYSASPKMHSAKNLMLWSSDAQPDPEYIDSFYMWTNYGDSAAYFVKKDALSNEGMPEEELVLAAHNALPREQQCFGEYSHMQLITHAFLHGGPFHLIGNMLFLLVFGSRVNAAIGNILTLILYPILGIAAALTHLAFLGDHNPTPMLGASGAVMGLAGAYLLLYPIHKIHMVIWMRWGLLLGFRLSFKCFAVRGFLVVLFYIMFDVIAVSLKAQTGTAHWAHIGGLVWGIILAFALLAGRIAYSRSDMLSLILGKYAWPIIGSPAARMK